MLAVALRESLPPLGGEVLVPVARRGALLRRRGVQRRPALSFAAAASSGGPRGVQRRPAARGVQRRSALSVAAAASSGGPRGLRGIERRLDSAAPGMHARAAFCRRHPMKDCHVPQPV